MPVGPREWDSSAIPAPGDTAQDPVILRGQAEAGRAQDSEDAPVGRPSCAGQRPPPGSILGVTAGVDSRAGELAAASVVVPPGVTLCLGGVGPPGNRDLTQ